MVATAVILLIVCATHYSWELPSIFHEKRRKLYRRNPMDCPCSHSRSGLKMRASSQKIDATLQGIPVSSPEMVFDGSVATSNACQPLEIFVRPRFMHAVAHLGGSPKTSVEIQRLSCGTLRVGGERRNLEHVQLICSKTCFWRWLVYASATALHRQSLCHLEGIGEGDCWRNGAISPKTIFSFTAGYPPQLCHAQQSCNGIPNTHRRGWPCVASLEKYRAENLDFHSCVDLCFFFCVYF